MIETTKWIVYRVPGSAALTMCPDGQEPYKAIEVFAGERIACERYMRARGFEPPAPKKQTIF